MSEQDSRRKIDMPINSKSQHELLLTVNTGLREPVLKI